jgi:serine/threonine-protein kinase RsbW
MSGYFNSGPLMKKIELCIPSVLGLEKVVIEKAAEIAREMGFPDSRVADLKTALSEACTNAIEHGNKLDQERKVCVDLVPERRSLQILIRDEGKGFGKITDPIVEDGIPQRRGWGVFLMRNLVNHFSYNTIPGKGNEIRMVFDLEKCTKN